MEKTGGVPPMALRSLVRRRDCAWWIEGCTMERFTDFGPLGRDSRKTCAPKTAHVFLECRGSLVQELFASSLIGTVFDPSG